MGDFSTFCNNLMMLLQSEFFVQQFEEKRTIFPSIFPGHHFSLDFDKRFVALSCTFSLHTLHSGLSEHEINFGAAFEFQ